MLAPVHLDRQLRLAAGKVDDEGADDELSREARTIA